MVKILQIIEVVLAIVLTALILLQHRGSGLGGAFGSDMATFHTRRGIEKFLYYGTIVLGVLFVLTALVNVYLLANVL